VLCTVAALPGAAAREIRAWDGVATSCVDRRATDAPDAAPLTGRLQELGAQHRARILPGALTLVLASRPPPRLSWSTTFKRGLTVVRGLGIFVFMKNHLVPVKSWKPVFKRRNSATLKKGHSIQVNINPTLQKCEHSPVVVKKTQIVFAPAPSRQTQSAAWTSTVAIIPTQYHEPPPNTRPQYACGRPLSHEQCKEGKTQQNSETRVFLRVHPFLSMDEQCPLCINLGYMEQFPLAFFCRPGSRIIN